MSARALAPLLPTTPPPPASPGALQGLANLTVGGLGSPASRRNYARYIARYLARGLPLSREGVQQWLIELREAGAGVVTRNIALAAVRLLAREANMRGQLPDMALSGIERIKCQKIAGERAGNWLELPEVRRLLEEAGRGRQGVRDAAILALMLGCGLRRAEVAGLEWRHWQQRGGRWCVVDLVGKGERVRTVPCPTWAASYLEAWRGDLSESEIARLAATRVFGLSAQGVFYVVRDAAARAGLGKIRPHDLRRTYAKLSRAGGASIEQISRTLGHASIQTTERYLGTALELRPGMGAGDYIKLDQEGVTS